MSTIVTSNVSDGTLSIPTTYVTNGSAKARLYYDQTGPTVIGSFNVSSVTDNSVGDFTVNLTNSFSDTNNFAVGGAVSSAGRAVSGPFTPLSTSAILLRTGTTAGGEDRISATSINGNLA